MCIGHSWAVGLQLRFLTHPFADFFSLPWEEFVLEHNRHHASTVDLLIQGEFGWDPEEFHYALQQWAGPFSTNWYKYLLTVPWFANMTW